MQKKVPGPQAPGAGEARADNLALHGLAVQLGPDLRVLYPMNVLNFGIAGELVATGPADPARLKLAGTIRCAPAVNHVPTLHVPPLWLPAAAACRTPTGSPQPPKRRKPLHAGDRSSAACRCRLQGGEVNLVATQLQLDREHPNRLVFSPEAGLDPAVDVVLAGSRLRAHINGRASAWQDHIVLTSGPRSNAPAGAGELPNNTPPQSPGCKSSCAAATVSHPCGRATWHQRPNELDSVWCQQSKRGSSHSMSVVCAGGEGAEQLDAAEAARIFEGQLAGALLAEDGQLALSSLASNTLSTLMPKLETQGRVGQARCAARPQPAHLHPSPASQHQMAVDGAVSINPTTIR